MKYAAKYAILAVCAALALVKCTSAQVQTAQTDAAQAQVVVDAGACDAQKAANDATAILTAAGDTAGAAQTSRISAVAGLPCMTLAPAAASAPAASTAAAAP